MKMDFTAKLLLVVLLTPNLISLFACTSASREARNSEPNSVQTEPSKNSTAANDSKNSNPADSTAAPRRISFEVLDKVEIIGTFYQSAKSTAPAVLLLHQWGATRASFDEFAKKLQAAGINVLTIDGRGFGESVKQGAQKIAPASNAQAVAGMLSDVEAALQFLEQQSNTDAQRLGIVGASYGSSLAIIHAANNSKIKAVALLSPGINYFGNLATENPVQKYGSRPLLLVAAEDDAESANAARRLDNLATGDQHQLKIFKRGGHGTALFKAEIDLETLLKEFLLNSLS